MKPSLKSDGSKAYRWIALGLASGLCVLLVSACSSPLPDCDPPIQRGTKYRVTVLGETPESDKCHIVKLQSHFHVTAEKEELADGPSCTMTPAGWAPEDPKPDGITVIRCSPSYQMLGTECEMQYPSRCQGFINFYFYAPLDRGVNWSAPRIEGARFRVKDSVAGCIPDQANCLDEYEVLLERI